MYTYLYSISIHAERSTTVYAVYAEADVIRKTLPVTITMRSFLLVSLPLALNSLKHTDVVTFVLLCSYCDPASASLHTFELGALG